MEATMAQAYSDARAYAGRIRNAWKREYAEAYIADYFGLSKDPLPESSRCGYMARQSVRFAVQEIVERNAESSRPEVR